MFRAAIAISTAPRATSNEVHTRPSTLVTHSTPRPLKPAPLTRASAGAALYKRNGSRVPHFPGKDRLYHAKAYVSAATNSAGNGLSKTFRANGKGSSKSGSLDVSEVNESQTLAMEDSAADEFIDMRVPTERAPMMAHAPRTSPGEGLLSVSSRGPGEGIGEGAGFGGGFGGGGGSGIGRGGIGRVMRPAASGRNSSGRNLGAGTDSTIM